MEETLLARQEIRRAEALGPDEVGLASGAAGKRRRPPRAQLRGGDPVRGGNPLGTGHAGSHHRGTAGMQ
ncbi:MULTISPECIES: hypothetical protein [Olsenella]|uniref:hypothetical protein n=1 Tax=Olsenella TaxID=133925 RepID=UPI00079A62C1|nr:MULTISPECIES: hypothetical protein [Olsenella]KXB61831.1 hypothetical protein HMPREF1868_01674 [Olsenella sp. DNF00959]